MINEFRQAAIKELDKRAATWRVERMALDLEVARAIEAKQPVVGDYWQAEYHAREKLRTAAQLVVALEDLT